MKDDEIQRDTIVTAGPKGGVLNLVDDETGELLAEFYVAPGTHRASHWLDLVQPQTHIEVGDGASCFPPRLRTLRVPYGHGATDSGANPDFQVTSATRFQRELDLKLKRIEAASDRMDRKLAARESALALRDEADKAREVLAGQLREQAAQEEKAATAAA